MNFLKIGKQLHHFPVDSLSAGKTIWQAAVVHGTWIFWVQNRDICELHVCEHMHVYKNAGKKIIIFDRAG